MPDHLLSQLYSIKIVHAQEIEPFTNQLADLRIEVFKEFPYLYDGNQEYEKKYLQTYIQSKNSIAVLVFDESYLVGASTGLPLNEETAEFRKPFAERGYPVRHIFYCGESILKKEYRGRGIYSMFIEAREKYARAFGAKLICFCAVSRAQNHPLRPEGYTPPDAIWKKFGYEKQTDLKTTYSWKDVNKPFETEKEMIFWIKKL